MRNPDAVRRAKRKYYDRNRERILARQRARRATDPKHRFSEIEEMWYARSPFQKRPWRSDRSRHHGLTQTEIFARLAEQGHVCAVCRTDDTAQWNGDHDHATGEFRGVLCTRCNAGLGLFLDSTDRLRGAIAYLEKHSL